jgi:hypothetical protein
VISTVDKAPLNKSIRYISLAITQAVSSGLLTAADQFRAQVRSYGISAGQSGIGVGFLLVLRFPLPILIPLIPPNHLSSGTGTIGQVAADVPIGLSLTPLKEI